MKPLIIFDFDGTLVDSIDTFIDIANTMAVRHGRAEEMSREYVRKTPTRTIAKRLGVPFWKVPGYLKEYFAEQDKRLPHLKLHHGMKTFLRSIKKKADFGIISSNTPEAMKKVLSNHGVSNLFSFVEGGSIFGKNKKINEIVKEREVKKSNVLYVGDETRDIMAARRAHVQSMAVTWGMQNEELLLRARPTLLARTMKEAEELFLAWISSRV